MRQSILVVTVLSLIVFCFKCSFGQVRDTTTSQINTGTGAIPECPSTTSQIPQTNRIGNARRCYDYGLKLTESGQLRPAAESFRQAVQFDPEYADSYSALGRTYFKLGEWQKAIDNLKLADTIRKRQRETQNKPTESIKPSTGQNGPSPTTNNSNPVGVSVGAGASSKNAVSSVEVKKVPAPTAEPVKKTPNTSPTPTLVKETLFTSNQQKNQSRQPGATGEAPKLVQALPSPTPQPTKETASTSNQPQNLASKPSPVSVPVKGPELTTVAVATSTAAVRNDSAPLLSVNSGVPARVATPVAPPPTTATASSPAPTLPSSEEKDPTKFYRIGPNDVLSVSLNTSDNKSSLYTVTATGQLEHPLLTEPMLVAGLTTAEITTRLEGDLRKRAIIEEPKADIGVRDYASHSVIISGLVNEPGTKFLRREAIPLYVVIADAQPRPEAAKITVLRNPLNKIYEFDLNQTAELNFLVRSGDVVDVRANTTQYIYVGGEVKFPGEKTFRRGLTLMQTILAAGGAGPKAKIAEVARDNGQGFLVPVRFNLKEIISGKAKDPLLKPGDRISILR